jgi:hypothetical protein
MDPIDKPVEALQSILVALEGKKKPKNLLELFETLNVCLLNSEFRRFDGCWEQLGQRAFVAAVKFMREGRDTKVQEEALESCRLASRLDPGLFCIEHVLNLWPLGSLPPDSWISRSLGEMVVLKQSLVGAQNVLAKVSMCLGRVRGERVQGLVAQLVGQAAEVQGWFDAQLYCFCSHFILLQKVLNVCLRLKL